MVRLERFERPTYGFVVHCSIQLSYKRKLFSVQKVYRIGKIKGLRVSVSPFTMVRLERFERPTYGFVVHCSIQLSYKRNLYQLGENSSTSVKPY